MIRFDRRQISILALVLFVVILLTIPKCKLPYSITTENLGVLNMPLRYYFMLAILLYLSFAHLTLLPDCPSRVEPAI